MTKLRNYLQEAKKVDNMIICPHCGRDFKTTDTEANDKLNQITLDNKGKPFFVMFWDTQDPFENKHILELYFYFNSSTQDIEGRWTFVSKNRTPLAISNMQNKKPLPKIFIKTNPKFRAELAQSYEDRTNTAKVNKILSKKLGRLDGNIAAAMNTGTEIIISKRQLRNLMVLR